MSIDRIAEQVLSRGRIDIDAARRLASHHSLPELGYLADLVRRRINGNADVTYVLGRNINYTNVCWVRCRFCAFYRVPGHTEGYVLSTDEIMRKVGEMVDAGGIEILMQGGLNPKLLLDWYCELFRLIKATYGASGVILHALSPAELIYIARMSKVTLRECLLTLQAAGLDSVPGGGAEILTERVREQIAPLKTSADDWLGCMREAHRAGLPTTATMMYGSVDTWEDRLEHLFRLRDLQDETGGFTAFIPWSFQPDGTDLGGTRASAFDYLRTVAVSRLVLDNIPHIQASWVTQGPKVAQIALGYGLDDFGSTMMEENVVSAAGCSFTMPVTEIERLIHSAGYSAVRRTTQYRALARSPRPTRSG